MPPTPLVVTLELDPETQARFERERAALFPAGRTAVGAHVTLFHAVPEELADAVDADLRRAARRPRFEVAVTGPYSLGRGVAYRLEAPELPTLHGPLQERWWDRLTPQDRQPLHPHVTVQNKVSPDEARSTLARLLDGFTPFRAQATGLRSWRYEGGPWRALGRYPFTAPGH